MSTKTATDPTTDWPTYYGIKLTDVGEDGEIVVLGHHKDPRRVVAAINRHARIFWGLPNIFDNVIEADLYRDAKNELVQRWAKFLVPNLGGEWCITWNAKPTHKGAFPVTMWLP